MNASKPVHAPQTNFAVVNNCLQVNGVPLTRLAQRVGSTPFYAYDRALLSSRVAYVREQLPSGVGLHYSVKANPMPALVQHMAGVVDGLDVASGGELKVALDTGMPALRISFAGPGKSDAELTQAIAAGACLNVESEREIRAVARIADAMGVAARVMVRVNPDFELKSSGMKMGGGAKPFGIDVEEVPRMLQLVDALQLDFNGFQIFSGSQSLKPEAIVESHARAFNLAAQLGSTTLQAVRHLTIGGAFGIPYFPGDVPLNLGPICEELARSLDAFKRKLPGVKVAIELGRYLVGEAGLYVARVVDRKVSRGQLFFVTDGGLHHHLAASGNFGQVIRKNFPVVIGNRMDGGAAGIGGTASIVGPLCTPLDVIADNMAVAHAQVGDLIVVFQSGAYGLSASPTAFLGHPAPAEVLV
jgi:diaminopimelate decarboxylase